MTLLYKQRSNRQLAEATLRLKMNEEAVQSKSKRSWGLVNSCFLKLFILYIDGIMPQFSVDWIMWLFFVLLRKGLI